MKHKAPGSGMIIQHANNDKELAMFNLNCVGIARELNGLDAFIHAPARLMLINLLFGAPALESTELLKLTGLTWGNLATHLSKLEEAGYVMISKSYKGKKPNTVIRITDSGRGAYLKWSAIILKAIPSKLLEAYKAGLDQYWEYIPALETDTECVSIPKQELFFLPKCHQWGMELHPIDRINQLA
ncbi:MAG: transcriptional regulator [Candidatus Cloacimonadaceae bacterium]|nr:transcriptional regulator [Candidatus Cloacimonadaceae bacterium]MDP3114704.1 transcriptional regulator [Candidatus Cloacimonadaceae bacterium]